MTKPESQHGDAPSKAVKQLGPPEAVPVFNCVVYVSAANNSGELTCRCANLEGLKLVAQSERDALQQVVSRFKEIVTRCQSAGTEIPWIDPPDTPMENESVRYLAVHL